MPSTTISLERSAYELLKARKKPDESFSEEVFRLLGEQGPQLKQFLDIVSMKDGKAVADAIEAIREEDLLVARTKLGRSRQKNGRGA